MDKFFKEKSIALFYGGRTPEHEVSIESAKTVYPILKTLFKKVYLIGVTKSGGYYFQNLNYTLSLNTKFEIKDEIIEKDELNFIPSKGMFLKNTQIKIDLAFILIHGNEGEDGKLQGLLDIMNIKYSGVNCASSALCMYKHFTSQVLKASNIKTVDTIVISKGDKIEPLAYYQEYLGQSLFIKSETTGSSVGVTALKYATDELLQKAINKGFKYSQRVLIQTLMEDIKEVEVAILELENHQLLAAGPGLVVKSNMKDILSYENKYGHIDSAYMDISAIKDEIIINESREQAIKIFKILNLSGYSRIDFFYKNKQLYLNEVNTIPGLTSKSHYPVLVESAQIPLDRAIFEICRRSYEG